MLSHARTHTHQHCGDKTDVPPTSHVKELSVMYMLGLTQRQEVRVLEVEDYHGQHKHVS